MFSGGNVHEMGYRNKTKLSANGKTLGNGTLKYLWSISSC